MAEKKATHFPSPPGENRAASILPTSPHMTRSLSIVGVVILYHPPQQVKANILSYLEQIDFLLVVDNSEESNQELVDYIKTLTKVEYLSQPDNPGLARALNLGAQKAQERGADFLLAMDQDSTPAGDMLAQLRQYIHSHDVSRVGIITPHHDTRIGRYPDKHRDYEEVGQTMMSGNLVNLKIYSEIGPFTEDLFLDYVDIEYYCRVRAAGYKIIQVNKAILLHNLGNIEKFDFLKIKMWTLNHPPLRWYYIIRNHLFVIQKYKDTLPDMKHHLLFWLTQMVKVLFFESDKLLKFKMMLAGFVDFTRGKLGKYHHR